jgi:protein SCO1/2
MVLTACGQGNTGRVVSAESGATDVSIPRPAFTLTDTDGNPFAFAERTAGRLTFLEFGYTNCPDVCPVHMANLATVITNLAPSDRMRTTVVFVTVDPDRDSPAVLRKWLNAFSVDFIGLRGSREQVDAAQKLVGFGAAIIGVDSGGAKTVTHAAPVIVFTADDTAHVMYPFGTRQADWIRDMPRLLARVNSNASIDTATSQPLRK